jgi:hypothetical protein
VTNEEIGLLHSGNRFKPFKKKIVAEREGHHSEIKEIDIGAIFQIEWSLRTKEEKIRRLILVEDDPTQIGLCFKTKTLCASPRAEVRSKVLSIVVSKGSKDSSSSNKSSGSSTSSRN